MSYTVIESKTGRMVVVAFPSKDAVIVKRGFATSHAALEWAQQEQRARSALRAVSERNASRVLEVIGWCVVIGVMAFCLAYAVRTF